MKKLKVGFVAGFMEGFSEERLKLFSPTERTGKTIKRSKF